MRKFSSCKLSRKFTWNHFQLWIQLWSNCTIFLEETRTVFSTLEWGQGRTMGEVHLHQMSAFSKLARFFFLSKNVRHSHFPWRKPPYALGWGHIFIFRWNLGFVLRYTTNVNENRRAFKTIMKTYKQLIAIGKCVEIFRRMTIHWFIMQYIHPPTYMWSISGAGIYLNHQF